MAGHNTNFPVPNIKESETRLLHVAPGSCYTDPLDCDLVVHSQDTTKDRYEALSYVWGNTGENDMLPITVNDQIFCITKNLDSALRHLRYGHRARILWVDAICINQNDDQEKNTLVPKMHLTYSLARKVLVWLGEADQYTISALNLTTTLSGASEEVSRRIRDGFSRAGALDPVRLMQVGGRLPGADDEEWSVFKSLFVREWWHRVWTLQEAVFARNYDLVCGPHSASGVDMENCTMLLNRMVTAGLISNEGLRSPGPYWQMMEVRNLRERTHKRPDIWTPIDLGSVLAIAQRRKATNPRDRFYGCFNLAGHQDGVDYSKSASQVFEDATRALIRDGRDAPSSLNFLAACSEQASRTSDIVTPSWTIDLQYVERHNTLCRPFGGGFGHAAAVDSLGVVSYNHHADQAQSTSVLTVNAILVDHIVSHSPPWPPPDLTSLSDLEHDAQLQKFYNESIATIAQFSNIKFHPHDRDVGESFHRTLVADRDMAANKIQTHMLPRPGKPLPVSYAQNMQETCWKRRVFVTSTGYIGLCPHVSRVGDSISVISGCDVPLVLRKITRGADCHERRCYVIIGDAYVHGMMQGEACVRDEQGRIVNFQDVHLH